MVSKKNLCGILALALVFGIALAGCDHNARGSSGSGGGGSDAPETITGFYGVTADGKTIEIILTPSNGTSQNARAIAGSGTYVIKIDGVIVSKGSFTNNGGTPTFTPTDDSTVNVSMSGGELTSITVVGADKKSYSGKTIESKDYYYICGIDIKYTEAKLTAVVSGKTLGELAKICETDSNFKKSNFEDYTVLEGTWDELVEIFIGFGYPASYFTNMASKLTEDTLLIWDWTEKSLFDQEQGDEKDRDYSNLMLVGSRMPMAALMNCKL
ncbi:MAG: hypothetical protein LBK66_01410 [Spirochaetaceae bacterium]|jgi:hypothetical protein|nr:hypothetical protein [Spirochaetaceae bacterium]